MRKLLSGQQRFIIRAGGNRRLHVEDESANKLREFASSSPIVCTREVHLSKRVKTRFRANTKQKLPRQSRQATLMIGAGAVQLRADVADGIEPVEWTLMTTEPIDTEEQILAVVDGYRHRWKIEPAQTVLSSVEFDVLRHAAEKPLPKHPTVRQAMLAIARLGGHLKRNGEPGWMVLGRGYLKLLDLAQGFLIAKRCDQS